MTAGIHPLIVSSTLNPTDGWGSMTHHLSSELQRRGEFEYHLAVPEAAGDLTELPYASRILVGLPRWRARLGLNPIAWLQLYRHRFSRPINLVHCLVEFPYSLLARRHKLAHGAPYVISTQGTYAAAPFSVQPDAWLYRMAMEDASVITAPSEYTAQVMLRASRLERPVEILHNAVDFERFQQPADVAGMRIRLEVQPQSRIILGVGGLKPRKGFDTLIHAFARVARDYDDSYLVIAGEGPSRSDLTHLARQLRLEDRIRIPGTFRGSDLVALYQACTVYSHLPRRVGDAFEGYGIVYLEAGACGKPVVGTHSGGVSEAVVDGETGYLVEESDAASAAEAILKLLDNPDLSQRLGGAGRDRAKERNWGWYTDRIVEIYSQVSGRD